MDEKRKFDIPIEQKFLLNCEHGPGPPIGPSIKPPAGPPQLDFLINRRLETNCDARKGNSEVFYHQSGAGAGLDIHDNSRHLMLMAPPGMVGPYFVVPSSSLYANHLGENLANSGQQNPNKKDDQIWGLNHFQKNVQNHSSQIDILIKQNDVLVKELALKSKELDDVLKAFASKSEEYEDLKSKFRQLTERLNDVPDISSENYTDDRLIDLAATDEMTGGCRWKGTRLEDEDDMMRSVQCSELSVEPCSNECNAEVKRAFDAGQVLQVTGRGRVSSGSNTSFEVVGPGFCEDQGELKRLDNKCYKDVKQNSENLRDKLHSVESQVETLESRLEQVEALKPRLEQVEKLIPRLEQVDALKLRVDELSSIVHLGARPKTTVGNAEFRLPGIGSKDCSPEIEDLRQTISELTAAKWKLTEQAKMLERENEELRSRVSPGDVQKDEDRIRELELEQRNANQFVIQYGTDKKVIELTTENALLKTQIETYNEDFEAERRDREKLNSERDTLKRFNDILRNDLDNARRQLRKYEDDITTLRIDNSTMRNRLREVTEELAAKDLKTQPLNPPIDFKQKIKPASQPQNIITPTSSSALPDPSVEWNCLICTLKNSGRRSCCEMCGTERASKSALTPRGPSASDFSGEELEPDRCRNEALAKPLLSNLRDNYGDIETD